MSRALLQPVLSAGFAFVFVMIMGPYAIKYLHKLKFGQNVRSDGPKRHLQKIGTPTMGGIMIMIALALSVLMFDRHNSSVLFALFVAFAFAAIGFIDDFLKTLTHSSLGLKARQKIFGQLFVAVIIGIYAINNETIGTELLIPFTGSYIELPVAVYMILAVLVMLGSANAVNLTDGLDGLASGTMAVASAVYAVISYKLGNPEIALFAGGTAGACLGFLWFNAHPAQVFMGDTGSLGLGAALGVMAIMTKTALCLPIIAGLYVLETLSVIMQIVYFKLTKGKRLFKMAPLHHHFELKGWEEPQVMIRFLLVSIFFGVLGLLAVL